MMPKWLLRYCHWRKSALEVAPLGARSDDSFQLGSSSWLRTDDSVDSLASLFAILGNRRLRLRNDHSVDSLQLRRGIEDESF
jgi:hypothetical protein